MNSTFYRLLLSLLFAFSLLNVHAQWTYACNDTLAYHNHQDGELMVHPTNNKLYSMQKLSTGNEFRLDVLEDEIWSPVLNGTDGLDFVVTEDEVLVLRKVSNQFVIENYDLDGNLSSSSTCSLSPLTSQFQTSELLFSTQDSIYIHFKDPGFSNGGSVFMYNGSAWSDLSSGKMHKVILDHSGKLLGLNTISTTSPASVRYCFKKFNFIASSWDSLTSVAIPGYFVNCDFIVGTNDSIYLAAFNSNYPPGVMPNFDFYTFKNGGIDHQTSIQAFVMESLTSVRLCEDKWGNIMMYHTIAELGPWGMPISGILTAPIGGSWTGFGLIIDPMHSEFTQQYVLVQDVIVDSSNTVFLDYSFHSDVFQNNGPDSVHTHIRKYNNCVFTQQQNMIDTVAGNLISNLPDYYQFQWIYCSSNMPILGANSSTLQIPGNGMYALVVSNGECSDTSECFDLTHLSVDELNQQEISLYPNPSNDYIFVQNLKEGAGILVSDIYGRIVFSLENGNTSEIIQISEWNSGTYFITIGSDKFSSRGTFIKN